MVNTLCPVSQAFLHDRLVWHDGVWPATCFGCALTRPCAAARLTVCCCSSPSPGDGGSMVSISEYLKMAGVSGGGAQYGKK